MNNSLSKKLQQIYEGNFYAADIAGILSIERQDQIRQIFDFADNIRKQTLGDAILLRGIIEISSYCRNSCRYCGLNKNNKSLTRYRMKTEEILEAADMIYRSGIRTVVIQSGEDEDFTAVWIADIIKQIKERFAGMAVTLSLGEWPDEYYRIWREAGADRYLLKIETTDRRLYERMHPDMSYDNRIRCLDTLKRLDYQTGSGCLVGLKGQTVESLASDVMFFREFGFDMLGIGLFIPHGQTELSSSRQGSLEMTLKVQAMARILLPAAHMPATTATGSISKTDNRIDALQAGANVIMPNFTPMPYRQMYEIYPHKRCVNENPTTDFSELAQSVEKIGRHLAFTRGDALRLQ
ncbi:Biotin synthase [Limihaloglobus sulfuriphilus]|uniref:Biotin synthase n=1 Tax=Limihaloglobus sulfuriphilus TaxID=1851148 RepID=A0A1Q2MAZ2_9BACT|nr:[FeFe] hydrogenase H-cluster radical SAM maturase HydE [Limihaloglobus sulfuriphilus]AQQ69830.1 Biotin synthase [Limihaloglobus sulfuriphilus]